jgi:ATP-dependent DNA helicase RecG
MNDAYKLDDPITKIKGIGEKLASKFAKRNITKISDLLYFFPTRYQDRRVFVKIKDIKQNQANAFIGTIKGLHIAFYKKSKKRVFEMVIADETDQITAKWFSFNENFVNSTFKKGANLSLFGIARIYKDKKEIYHPDIEFLTGEFKETSKIIPVYPDLSIPQKNIRKIIDNAVLDYSHRLTDDLLFLENIKITLAEGVRGIHWPNQDTDINALNTKNSMYHNRVKYSELFYFLMELFFLKNIKKKQKGNIFPFNWKEINDILEQDKIELTSDQKKVLNEIELNTSQGLLMDRVIIGEVGCGKTLISVIASYACVKSGYEACLFAPTEVLVEQHYNTFSHFLANKKIKIEKLTSSSKNKKEIISKLASGEIDILIGTHAILSEDVQFKNLGLVTIDEQQRFGVTHRYEILKKGNFPHRITMTATPIPRSLAMLLWGEFEFSIITQFPKKQRCVHTKILEENKRNILHDFMKRKIKEKNRIFIVVPAINEERAGERKNVMAMYKNLTAGEFKGYKIGCLFGAMKEDEKKKTVEKFKKGEFEILVSTTVIEVGIDIKDANVIVIEEAHRYGLSQLHQLRGRVGRGENDGYCFLMVPEEINEGAATRLKFLSKTQSGFEISEYDLKKRGPGEFIGTLQSGAPDFRFADLFRDIDILKKAKEDVLNILNEDPQLASSKFLNLKNHINMKI